jgi:branched-chain amino acid transport system substrate-binding protein
LTSSPACGYVSGGDDRFCVVEVAAGDERRGVSRPAALLDRRRFLRLAGLSGAAALAGCRAAGSLAGQRPLKLGWISARSGRYGQFGAADDFVLQDARRAVLGHGLELGGRTWPVRLLVRDSGSDPALARLAARDLVEREQVDLVLAGSTVETTAPVADVCEAAAVPCLTTGTPYQVWFTARQGTARPPRPFQWTWHFCWGLEDVIGVFADLWGTLPNRHVLGLLRAGDREGRLWGDPRDGLPAFLEPQGYRIVDPGPAGPDADLTRWVDRFRTAGADVVTGVTDQAAFADFWRRAGQRRWRPKAVSISRALAFPAFLEAMGDAEGLSAEVAWSPGHPFRSSLTGASAARLADAYSEATGLQWIQPLGLAHALLEVAVDALRRAGDPGDKPGIAAALGATSLDTIAGHVAWSGQADLPNVARTPLVGGQWRRGRRWPLELVVVSNAAQPEIPTGGTLQPLA